MVTAVILINTQRGQVTRVAEHLAERAEISEVYSVAGGFDLVAIVRVHQNEDLARLVTDTIQNLDGIDRTETLIAFKAYSRHDLDGMFSVGMQ
ncbi:MAG: Lrp/AsnC ligand binding domain-containing protein [Gammaproteobacteria bacterium]|nr:Lrp/AsnC ligand binding domain-containing protein [Gammaproteobacteria bacterium]